MSNCFVQVFSRMVLMGLLMLMGGCAAKKIMVKNADNLLEHQIAKRLPLYTAQKNELSKDISKFLNENRAQAQELLPVIDELNLEDPKKFEGQYKTIARMYDKISLNFSAILAKYMAELDSKQQKEFFENLSDENRQLSKKDPDHRLKKFKARFKTFFGVMNSNQKQLLTDMQDQLESSHKAKLVRRGEIFQKLKNIYAHETSRESRQEAIMETFKSYQKSAHNHEKNMELLKKILSNISKEQKEYFRKQVAEVKAILKLYLDTDY